MARTLLLASERAAVVGTAVSASCESIGASSADGAAGGAPRGAAVGLVDRRVEDGRNSGGTSWASMAAMIAARPVGGVGSAEADGSVVDNVGATRVAEAMGVLE